MVYAFNSHKKLKINMIFVGLKTSEAIRYLTFTFLIY